tara:strand:+ start:22258 stop:24387 length:2130 start_codon:yes stop_codon:yes gene_type:complete
MKQVFQNMKNGKPELVDEPIPMSKNGEVIIKAHKTLISKGTEKMLTDFGKSNLIGKALKQPEKVKLVLNKIKTDGIAPTLESVNTVLNKPLKMGYCHVGSVLDNGNTNYFIGDRVVSNGSHGEVTRVPYNLTAKIPENVSDEAASFTVLGAIALQGIRLISPTIGETIVVSGLGLIGLLAVQILKANGCRVIGIDLDTRKCDLAKELGVDVIDISKNNDVIGLCKNFTNGIGVDAVLITASSKSNEIIHQSAQACRKRARIVLVGVIGLELKREDFYDKELSFQVSCSYGPGRYEEKYENKGLDYPIGYVRWTEKRNFETILNLLSERLIKTEKLVTHRFTLDDIEKAYGELENENSLGIILDYEQEIIDLENSRKVLINDKEDSLSPSKNINISFIGAGNYATRFLMPNFKKNKSNLKTIVTSGGSSAVQSAKKFGFENASTNIDDALNEETDTLVIATQHNLHANQVILGLKHNKNIFVEKPLALTKSELSKISNIYEKMINPPTLMVGFNRRFSPFVKKIKNLIDKKHSPKCFIFTMNAGYISPKHWTQQSDKGGGRIIGEACHYIDLMLYLSNSSIESWSAIGAEDNNKNTVNDDRVIINLKFENGSIGSIHYLSNGGPFPKERIEVFCDNSVLQLDNFKKLKGFGWKGFSSMRSFYQDKGQKQCIKEFIDCIILKNNPPIPFSQIKEVSQTSIDIASFLRPQQK